MDQPNEPHIIFLPFPVQGHIKPMLILAQLLSHAGFRATFINSHHNQARLERSTDMAAFFDRFPKLRFMSVSDGLKPNHPRNGSTHFEVISSTRAAMMPEFRKLLINVGGENGRVLDPPTCLIADAFMSFGIDIAEEIGIPVISFQSFGATSTWVYSHLSKLVEEREVPFQGDLDMNKPIVNIPGLESILRRQDLPTACRICKEANDPYLQFLINEMATMRRASRLVINTFEELESSVISELGSFFPRVYSIGPLHGLLESFNKGSLMKMKCTSSIGMLRREDKNCLTWLDSKPPKSVIYVCLGSLAGLSRDQLLELWHGLVNSGKFFLWVIRTDMIVGEEGLGEIPGDLQAATRKRGCIVDWAPQVEVLCHSAIGGFFTHSGWNSTLESVLAGVPMICWSQLAEQPVNSRCVSEMWNVGIDMKDTSDRSTIEKTVRDLMENKRKDLFSSMDEIAKMAQISVKEGGSSYGNFIELVEDIRNMSKSERAPDSDA